MDGVQREVCIVFDARLGAGFVIIEGIGAEPEIEIRQRPPGSLDAQAERARLDTEAKFVVGAGGTGHDQHRHGQTAF